MNRMLLIGGCASLIALNGVSHAADPARGQAADSGDSLAPATLEEIVVTATKSGAQTVFRTPMAIQAFSGESLKEQNIKGISDLVGAIPGAAEGQNTADVIHGYTLRGVGAGVANGDSPTGYYLDDVPFVVPNFGIAPPVQFLDLERVEVLRGPQGTLYGQGAAGGTMIFHTKDPDLRSFAAAVEAVGSRTAEASDMNYAYSGAVSIPLQEDRLALRLSAGYRKNQGFADAYSTLPIGAPDEKDANSSTNEDVRAVLLWKPAANARIRAQFWRFNPSQVHTNILQSLEPPQILFTSGRRGFSEGTFDLSSVSATVDLADVSLTSATSYLDGDFSAFFLIPGGGSLLSEFRSRSFTQEVRASSTGSGPWHWVAGGQYQDARGPQRNLLIIPAILTADTSNSTTTKNWAAFGELRYDLFGGKLVPLVGLRYYRDDRGYSTTDANGTIAASNTSSKTTWRLNLSYFPTDDVTAFATVSTGFRAGIVQSAVQVQLLQGAGFPATIQNRPDSLTNYELGVKVRAAGGRLNLAASAYRIEMTDMQLAVTGLAGVGGFLNGGDGHSNGLDLEAHWRTPLDGLSFGAVANVNDSKFDRVNAATQAQVPAIRPGGRLLNTTRYNYRFDTAYEASLTDAIGLFANASYGRFGERETPFANVTVPSYKTINAAIGLRSGPWEVQLYGDNLADDRGPTSVFQPGLVAIQTPRTIGLRLRFDHR